MSGIYYSKEVFDILIKRSEEPLGYQLAVGSNAVADLIKHSLMLIP